MAALCQVGDLRAFLALDIPTGYVLALQDQSIPPDVARRFVARLPACRYAEVDAGHNLMVTAPDATADALIAMAAS